MTGITSLLRRGVTPPPPKPAASWLVECDNGHDTVRWSKTVQRRCWICHEEDWEAGLLSQGSASGGTSDQSPTIDTCR